jgi:hypothetical protein
MLPYGNCPALGRLFVVSLPQDDVWSGAACLGMQISPSASSKNKHATGEAARFDAAFGGISSECQPQASLHSAAFWTMSSAMNKGGAVPSVAQIKAQRRADALRENLKKRKEQVRGRRELQAEDQGKASDKSLREADNLPQETKDHTSRS